MDYPSHFPQRSKDAVEIARLKAKADFHMAKRSLRGAKLEQCLRDFVSKIFFAFAREACQLVRERKWTLDQTRGHVSEFLRRLIIAEYYENLRGQDGSELFRSLEYLAPDLTAYIQNSDEWRAYEVELIASAEAEQEKGAAESPARRGYQAEVRQWMERSGHKTIAQAARQLGVSTTTLKSIMYPNMDCRHSAETERSVLKKIGLE